jgi:thiosulfate dehydrogenase [quinone] large subunit
MLLGPEWKAGKNWATFFGRLALGFVFLWGGIQKILTELSGRMATEAFLGGPSVANGPFAGFFNGVAGNWTVEYLVVYGELLIGLALIFGVLVRFASYSGIAMMTLFTVAMWPIADKPTDNPIVDVRTFYLTIFVMMVFLAPGRFLGVDRWLESTRFVQKHKRLTWLLG